MNAPMSLIRPVLFAIAALVSAPSVGHTADSAHDEVCLAWVHVFEDFEVHPETNQVTFSSRTTCLARATSIEELEPPEGKPHHGGRPDWSAERECAELSEQIDEMRRALRQASAFAPAAQQALADALGDADAEHEAYLDARGKWEAAVAAVEAAKQAYEDVYVVEVETERDGEGRVVVVRRRGYDGSTALGRAVLDAMAAEAAARRAMDDAWARWAGAGGSKRAAQDAQFRVDQYAHIIGTYPGAIEEARAFAADQGCS